jgi:probable O-glycosylation ligase (exosortase A-associated)
VPWRSRQANGRGREAGEASVFGSIFVIGLTLWGAWTSLFHPFRGLLIYVAFSILQPQAIWGHALPDYNYSRIVAIALLAGWLMSGMGDWRFGRGRAVVVLFITLFGWMALSAVLAEDREKAFVRIEQTSKILLPFLVGVTHINSVARLKQLTWVIVLAHGYVGFEMNKSYFDGYNVLEKKGFAGMDNNTAACFMVGGIGPALFLGLVASRWWQKAIAMAAALLLAHAVLFSFSRGAMLSMGVVGAVSFILLRKRPLHYLVFAGVVALVISLAGKEVTKRFETTFAEEGQRDASAQSRVDLARTCVRMMLDNPVFGVGPDHFSNHSWKYGWTPGKQAHTTWLQAGAELGIPGMILLVGFYLTCMVKLAALLVRPEADLDPWLKDQARMVIAGFIGFAVAAQFVSLIGLETPYYMVMLGVGALKLASPVATPAEHDAREAEEAEPFVEPAAL